MHRFPASLLVLWIHWCIPNDTDKIPALRYLKRWNFNNWTETQQQQDSPTIKSLAAPKINRTRKLCVSL
eukprot:scaffold2767_cov177-Amphora_coffeaeformis.AAC.84